MYLGEVARKKVIITVAGGKAYVADKPDDVDVHIIDFDNLADDYSKTVARYTAAELDYLELIAAESKLL